jgi:multicomponent Na+:H+ antiporter subunit C
MIDFIVGHYNYWIVILLMMIGFYTVISRGNLIKKIAGLNIFQTSVFLLYISMGKVKDGTAPILVKDDRIYSNPLPSVLILTAIVVGVATTPIIAEGFTEYSNPLPHVLILTAIVVGVSTTALGLALVVRIREAYGSIEEDNIHYEDEDASL